MRGFLVVMVAALLSGCATQPLAPPSPAWTKSGMVNWNRGNSALTADFDLGGDADGNLILVIEKHQRLLTIIRQGNRWSTTGPLSGPGWAGERENAPIRLAGWLTLADTLGYIHQAPPSVHAVVSGNARARWTPDGAEIITAETGEQFRVIWH